MTNRSTVGRLPPRSGPAGRSTRWGVRHGFVARLAAATAVLAALLAPASPSQAQTDDCEATTSTTCTVTVNGSTTGEIEATGDTDWFRVTLAAGTEYQIRVRGAWSGYGTLADPHLYRIKDSEGFPIAGTEDADGGIGFDSEIIFEPTETGTYYLEIGTVRPKFAVGLWYALGEPANAHDEDDDLTKGTYTVSVATPPNTDCERVVLRFVVIGGEAVVCISKASDSGFRLEGGGHSDHQRCRRPRPRGLR